MTNLGPGKAEMREYAPAATWHMVYRMVIGAILNQAIRLPGVKGCPDMSLSEFLIQKIALG